ncbi:MAG: SMC-Scp complex subunit ScpB, partial [Euryarchaeota archaeon]|nr:SMC-Scp complex subunit ScpB [Euryarchaeota archaeon]
MSDSVELSTILEAILFSAGRSMTVDELMEQTGKTRTEVSGALE